MEVSKHTLVFGGGIPINCSCISRVGKVRPMWPLLLPMSYLPCYVSVYPDTPTKMTHCCLACDGWWWTGGGAPVLGCWTQFWGETLSPYPEFGFQVVRGLAGLEIPDRLPCTGHNF